jgi:hypothetical protein
MRANSGLSAAFDLTSNVKKHGIAHIRKRAGNFLSGGFQIMNALPYMGYSPLDAVFESGFAQIITFL